MTPTLTYKDWESITAELQKIDNWITTELQLDHILVMSEPLRWALEGPNFFPATWSRNFIHAYGLTQLLL